MRARMTRTPTRQRDLKQLGKYPLGSDNLGWHKHYAQVYNKTQTFDSAHLAMWYLLLHLAFGEEQ